MPKWLHECMPIPQRLQSPSWPACSPPAHAPLHRSGHTGAAVATSLQRSTRQRRRMREGEGQHLQHTDHQAVAVVHGHGREGVRAHATVKVNICTTTVRARTEYAGLKYNTHCTALHCTALLCTHTRILARTNARTGYHCNSGRPLSACRSSRPEPRALRTLHRSAAQWRSSDGFIATTSAQPP